MYLNIGMLKNYVDRSKFKIVCRQMLSEGVPNKLVNKQLMVAFLWLSKRCLEIFEWFTRVSLGKPSVDPHPDLLDPSSCCKGVYKKFIHQTYFLCSSGSLDVSEL